LSKVCFPFESTITKIQEPTPSVAMERLIPVALAHVIPTGCWIQVVCAVFATLQMRILVCATEEEPWTHLPVLFAPAMGAKMVEQTPPVASARIVTRLGLW
jgi:hypothetical protein